jgi:NAD(P)-dependent dehydrogenase (short-subunit alcohol dehydrogenase family)
MKDLKGKVAVVTGAASGIGRAMAERFAREGMKVVLADVEPGPLGEARDAIAKTGASTLAVQVDVSSPEQVEALARKTFEAFGTAHVICNNAGIGAAGLMWQVPLADWSWILGVNLLGVVHGVRAFVPRMVEQGEGHVVNTASIAGLIAAPGMAAYCATKHAVVAMSECLHHDLTMTTGGKVHVSVLCPAWVKTRIADSGRNRPPPALAVQGGQEAVAREATQQEKMMDGMMRAAIESGIPPEVVADKVHAAIVGEKFWILTHSKTKKTVEKRMQGILEDRLPELELPGS